MSLILWGYITALYEFTLPVGVTVLERGWLSSNNILIQGTGPAALIDSGYCTHAPQTLALVKAALGSLPLVTLINTHLHSDHCGGNAALQAAYPRSAHIDSARSGATMCSTGMPMR
jgi:glyoxylase-like metal-dependent hydrolase (beta-lactamase superfamily II)